MKIYIAAPHDYANIALRLAYGINKRPDTEVVSTWFTDVDAGYNRDMRPLAVSDIQEVRSCDLLLCISPESSSSKGGYHTEFGLALGMNKPIILLGKITNVFHHLGPGFGVHHIECRDDTKGFCGHRAWKEIDGKLTAIEDAEKRLRERAQRQFIKWVQGGNGGKEVFL